MAISMAGIDRSTADGAREDLRQYNEDLIAKSKADKFSHIVRLESTRTLSRLQKACKDFEQVDRTTYSEQ